MWLRYAGALLPNSDISFIYKRFQPFRLCVHGIRVAFSLAAQGRVRDALKTAIYPVGYWRFLPIAYLLHFADQFRGCRILDVASPKLVGLYLAHRNGCEVHATDLDDDKIFSRWRVAANALKLDRYRVSFQDARRLRFPDNHFDLVYSISVIEHIPEDGDTLALREFHRVLKPSGVALVEVPYRNHADVVSLPYDSKGMLTPEKKPAFYERHYDSMSLSQRLAVPGMAIEKRLILGEWLPLDPWIATDRLPRPLRVLFFPFEPLLAAVNYWARSDDRKGRPLAALLVYRKTG